MIEHENQQNSAIFTVQSLDLDFNKNKKRNKSAIIYSSTDRINNPPSQPNYETLKTDRSVLIQKKKNYSNAIRQRNQNLLTKKKKSTIIGHCGQFQNKDLKNLIQIKENIETEPVVEKKQTKNKKLNHIQSKKILYKKSFDSMCSLDMEPITLMKSSEQISKIEHQTEPMIYSTSTFQLHEQIQFNQRQQKLNRQAFCSNVYSQRVYVFDSDATVLMRQNTTFKRDLANFRKENSQLRKQLQNAKKHAEELQQKTKSILESSLISSSKVSQNLIETIDNTEQTIDNSGQIIQKLRQQILELKSLNSSLQLKAYMAQKRVIQEVALCKKKMAKQLGEWREKCTKLRAQNMKYKSFRDMTISMEISRDQQ